MSANGGHFRHDALLYDSGDAFVRALVPFVREGIHGGGAAVAVTSRPNLERLRAGLGEDADAVRFVDAADWYVRPMRVLAGYDGAVHDLLARGATEVRVVGEIPFGESEEERAAWIRYEAALNGVFEGYPVWIVCPYDIRALTSELVAAAHHTHPAVWDGSGRRPNTRYVEPSELLRRIREPTPEVDGASPLLETRVEGDVRYARHALLDAVRDCVVAGDRAGDVVIAVNEILTNAVRHGGGRGRLTVWCVDGSLVCEVQDHGPGLRDPMAGYRPPPPEGATRGMGLWIARQLSDVVAVDTGGNGTTVRLCFGR